MRPVYVVDVVKNIWDMKGNVITISTKSILLEVLHVGISYFTPNLARSKRSGYYTNMIVKITGPDININNTREAFWSIGQEHVYKSGVSPLKHVGTLIRLVRLNTSHTSDSPLRWYKLQFMSPKNRQILLSVKKNFRTFQTENHRRFFQ